MVAYLFTKTRKFLVLSQFYPIIFNFQHYQFQFRKIVCKINVNFSFSYAGRHCSPATATGNKHQHMVEQAKYLNDAMEI